MKAIGIPIRKSTALLVIDIQERLIPVIHNKETVISNSQILIKGAEILSLTCLLTEQYPKGLGSTCIEISQSLQHPIIEKITFSCMQSSEVLDILQKNEITDLVICGIEAHICVLKTCIEAIQKGFIVHVVADAISSRTPENIAIAIQRMTQSGAFITSTEMILFMLLNEAGTDEFKAISQLIK
jgi:nicotinamidase-related amidase